MSLTYSNHTIDLLCKSMDWFLHDCDFSSWKSHNQFTLTLTLTNTSFITESLSCSPMICWADQWNDFHVTGTSDMKQLTYNLKFETASKRGFANTFQKKIMSRWCFQLCFSPNCLVIDASIHIKDQIDFFSVKKF